jgi:hypothetical protein
LIPMTKKDKLPSKISLRPTLLMKRPLKSKTPN